ncbi:MAG TPA: sugar ABC transporter permease, partial [Candidatus Ornithocaccomicrobium faecavium]|nr:sugar ABC transporter permease [Candidatus Ornithocaccomicrobium faecavium]
LILRAGSMLSVGFEKVYLLQNDLNRDVSEIISTYTYRLGILNGQFSYTTAIGLFNNIINAVILVVVNQISRTVGETSLW